MTTEHTDAHAERDRQLIAARKDHLMTELTARPATAPNPAPRAPRRRFRRLALATVTVAAVTAGATVLANTGGGPTGQGPAAFAVEKLPDGPVKITIVDTDVAAKEMTRQLHAQGLNVTVVTVPASPQIVGTWLEASFTTAQRTRASWDDLGDQMQTASDSIELPAQVAATGVTLTFGRAPKPGEALMVAGVRNALRPSGPLFCYRLAGATPTVAAQALRTAGYTVHYDTGDWRQATATPPAGLVVRAYIWDQVLGIPGTTHDVYLTVLPTDSRRYQGLLWSQWPQTMHDSGVMDYSTCPAS